MEINKKLLPMKSHYFLWNAGTAPVVPFMSVYARQLGFSSVIVGFVYMIVPIAGMIAKPTMGLIADRYKCQKLIFVLAQVITAFAFLSIYYVPSLPINQKMHLSCDNGVASLRICFNRTNGGVLPEKLIKSNSNESIRIKVDCLMEDRYWGTICNKWNVKTYCEEHPTNLIFEAYVPYSRIIDISNCLYFEVENASVGSTIHKPICSSPSEKISTFCDVKSTSSTDVESVLKSIDDKDVVNYYQFWLFLMLMIISWCGQAVVVSVGDAICFELLDNNPNDYGKQRSYGALGWGIFSIIAGYMVDNFGGNGERNYLSVFYLAFAVLLLDFFISTRLKYVQKNLSTTILKDVWRLLSNVRILIFIIWCIAIGLCTGVIWNFLLWLLEDLARAYSEDSKNWITTLQGLAMAIQCLVGELPFFFLSSWILKRIGHVNAMTLILAVIGIRYILYSIITNPWLVLPVEILNGITFGLAYASMASYACVIAPPGASTTVQGLTGAVFEGAGVSIGSLLGGILYEKYGGAIMFRIFGVGSLVVCLLHVLVQYLIRNKDLDKDLLEYVTPQEALSMVREDYQELRTVS